MPIKGAFTGAADVVVTAAVDVQVRTAAKSQPAAPDAAPPAPTARIGA
jgi:hypothetical protein